MLSRVPLLIPFWMKALFQNIVPPVSLSSWETKWNHSGLGLANKEDRESQTAWFSGMCVWVCCHYEEAVQYMFKFSVKISWQTLITDCKGVWELMDCSAAVFMDGFSNFLSFKEQCMSTALCHMADWCNKLEEKWPWPLHRGNYNNNSHWTFQ
jgi:hypothetical protein